MTIIEERLAALGLSLPAAAVAPPGVAFSFAWVRVSGRRVLVSGHSPQADDGTLVGPFGKVPSEVSIEEATLAARQTVLSVLGSVKRAIGDLDRIAAWVSVSGMVNAESGYGKTTNAINGFSGLVLELFGPEIGNHARTAVGYAALPLNNAVVVGAELELRN
ncbi:RidA family protein [Gryllotalpicola protaetiae]|uniref:RidA family protein n=1 Tax=Gryllotalpicola protaetiae TaxID=2419771 RepID=A0A387BJK2_9MICO|nr:RidA family protein [Gryllotalpicola protaetiae]AYG02334.1 RidA family protein [Gryllotalpicola protaetiae]